MTSFQKVPTGKGRRELLSSGDPDRWLLTWCSGSPSAVVNQVDGVYLDV